MEMKLLRAFIEASGFDVEEVVRESVEGEEPDFFILDDDYCVDYKVTKRKGRSELHRVVREYETGKYSIGEMINEIARIESITDE